MAKKALVVLAEGFEEVEAITPIDYLRRAGVEVTAAAMGEYLEIRGSHGVVVQADVRLAEAGVTAEYDALILPGGLGGSKRMAESVAVGQWLREAVDEGTLVCAICAAPALVLAPRGLLKGRRFTCYPGMEGEALAAPEAAGARWSPDRVVVDGPVITSRGAGTAGEFAAAIIGRLVDEETARKIAGSVLLTAATA